MRALAGLVLGGLLLPSLAGAFPGDRKVVKPAPAAATSAAQATAATPPRVSPYFLAARQHAQAASRLGHAPSVPPSMRRTRQPLGQPPPR